MNKKGVSGVVTTVILIALVMATVTIVWAVVNNMIKGGLGGAEACFGNFEKVTINGRYTCYDSASKQLQFSLSIEDIDLDKVLVSISGEGKSKSFKISSELETVEHLTDYSGNSSIILPEKNGGSTYFFDLTGGGFSESPDSIEIAPIIDGQQCGVSDSLFDIEDCSIFN